MGLTRPKLPNSSATDRRWKTCGRGLDEKSFFPSPAGRWRRDIGPFRAVFGSAGDYISSSVAGLPCPGHRGLNRYRRSPPPSPLTPPGWGRRYLPAGAAARVTATAPGRNDLCRRTSATDEERGKTEERGNGRIGAPARPGDPAGAGSPSPQAAWTNSEQRRDNPCRTFMRPTRRYPLRYFLTSPEEPRKPARTRRPSAPVASSRL